MKVACTWEGMQAARDLKTIGFKTLATAVFSMPQAILAGEAGCVSISPFCHELKALMDESYVLTISFNTAHSHITFTLTIWHSYIGSESIAPLCVEAQKYYAAHGLPTKVKACGTKTVEEIMALAGVDAFTLMPNDLATLSQTLYDPQSARIDAFSAKGSLHEPAEKISYIDDEARYRIDFAREQDGLAQYKLMQVRTWITERAG